MAEARANGDKIGAVMIVGAGIGGMQAALDLANAGFKVYLLEESTAIGGRMAQLDKTFPTNDCSMCTISPRLVEVDKHINVDIITNAEVLDIKGEPGNFSVKVLKKPRYVDPVKCNACGDCVQVCPVEIPNEFDEALAPRKAIYKKYPQAIPNAYAIEKRGTAPCKAACPSHVHVQGYIALILQGKYQEALALIRKDNPFPSVCGRVCTKPCERECTRNRVDEPVAIDYLKRYVADLQLEAEKPWVPPMEEKKEEKVAIVGAGPAGLTCAYYLAIKGYQVTVFEAMSEPGGMLRYGIPEYRLPKNVLNKEIGFIKDLGVTIKTDSPVGPQRTIRSIMDEGYKAVFLSVGARSSQKLNVPGEDLRGVIHGVDFLRRVNTGEDVKIGRRVAVIGGGNVAMDSSRTALRLGAEEVIILYRRTRAEMPADDEEIEEALQEGVRMEFLVAPVEIIGDSGSVKAIRCIRMKLGEPDETGRRRPEPVPGTEFEIELDSVIPAIGQRTDLSFAEGLNGLETTPRGLVKADPVTLETSVSGVFAGGDLVTGPATVIQAIAAGKEAAESIHRYLRGIDLREGRAKELRIAEVPITGKEEKIRRQAMPKLPPEERKNNFREVQLGFSEEQVREEAKRCLSCGICSECLQCVEACQPKAINHDMEPEEVEIKVGSVILMPGYDVFQADLKGEYGYGRIDNVITSLEFERILSASGPYGGEIKRPSDGKHPLKIAWIQCVGSRDVTCGRDYCSSVCCMYATKQAIIAREHDSRIEATIFYNDIRAFGKGFELYYESARRDFGVRYVKGVVSTVKELQKTKNLLLTYVKENGEVTEEEFHLVVLSVGLVPSKSVDRLAKAAGIKTNRFGFCETDPFRPNVTNRPGIFVAGVFEAPMDIPEAVMGASSAAALAAGLLSDVRGTMVAHKEYPPERTVSDEEPRIGVFVCDCGTNIRRVVNVPEVVEYAKTLPNVVHAEENLYTCSTDTTRHIAEVIKEQGLNRVVVASCTPRTHEPLFRDTLKEAGLNKYLFEMANIRDQDSWVHADFPEAATEKAKDLVRMAVARAAYLEPIEEKSFSVVKRGLVIGGGLAGMTAALSLADQGFETCIVERENRLGGLLWEKRYLLEGNDVKTLLNELISKVTSHPKIRVLLNAEMKEFSGHVGQFKALVATPSGEEEVEAGAIIVATGGAEYKPEEYLYGKNKRVMTQNELERSLADGNGALDGVRSVVMIQCVGSREEEHLYCSRVCCSQAIKNSLKIKEHSPETSVYVLFRDIRTYGFKELYYRKAREAGVVFIKYDPDRKPEVTEADGRLVIKVYDEILGEDLTLPADLLVLSAAIRPHPETQRLSSLMKLSCNLDGFFMEAHMKLRPLDFSIDGIYLAGLAHGPKFMSETIAQARGAAARAATILSKDQLQTSGEVSVVDPSKCVACLTCIRVCPFDVPTLVKGGEEAYMEEVAYIDPALCQGCGICAAACPRKAIEVQHHKDIQILAKVAALNP